MPASLPGNTPLSVTRQVLGQNDASTSLRTGLMRPPALTGQSLRLCPQMGIARPLALALALSLGRLSASSNLCLTLETFNYRNLFLPHPASSCLDHHADLLGGPIAARAQWYIHSSILSKHARSLGAQFKHHLRQSLRDVIHARHCAPARAMHQTCLRLS